MKNYKMTYEKKLCQSFIYLMLMKKNLLQCNFENEKKFNLSFHNKSLDKNTTNNAANTVKE